MKSQSVFESIAPASTRQQIVAAIKGSKEYRDAFVESQIKIAIPFQIRTLRKKLGWSQRKLGQMAQGISQEVISRLESPGYGRLTLNTALRLASAFDVGLMLRFVPFSTLVDWAADSGADWLFVPTLKDDTRLDEPYPSLVLLTSPTLNNLIAEQSEPRMPLKRATEEQDALSLGVPDQARLVSHKIAVPA